MNNKILTNLRKARSLLDKIINMYESKEYCMNIMQQNLAVIGLLKSAHMLLLEDHLKSCFASAMKSNDEKLKQNMIEEILTVTKISNK